MSGSPFGRAKDLFQQALREPPADREAFVREACGADQALCREVLSLLEFHATQTLLPGRLEDTRRELPPTGEDSSTGEDASNAGRCRTPPAVSGRLRPRDAHRGTARRRSFLNRFTPGGQLALGGLLATLFLLLVGTVTTRVSGHAMSQLRLSSLSKLLQANVESLGTWARLEKLQVEAGARDIEFRRLVEQLVRQADQWQREHTDKEQSGENDRFAPDELRDQFPEGLPERLRQEIRESFHPNARYALWNRQHLTIADWSPEGNGVGEGVTDYGAALLNRVFRGETVLQMPGVRDPITKDYPVQRPQHLIGVVTPVRNQQGQIIAAVLIYGLKAEQRFQEILNILRLGDSFESYAFDDRGLMISESRFNDQLKKIGILPDTPTARSSLNVRISDPGGDMTRGFRPAVDREALPLTLMARHAIARRNGKNARGYRDYRGVWVVGAWQWIDEPGFGVTMEGDYDEAFAEFRLLRYERIVLFGLLVLAVAALVWSYRVTQQARLELARHRRIGPYHLQSKLGEGGMGQVFLAHHALLKRPTAVKLLRPDVVSELTLAWFEREVQLAARLTHPNTIEIYDYGQTEEGEFYFAMEYLTGITLDELMRLAGPLPPARCVYLLRQACLSLREAHRNGLVHRDIKPQNIMSCARGGQYDVVKVLDFGLAKDLSAASENSLDTGTVLVGTPLYMAPERIESPASVDARADIYALGAVAYKLLTGCDVFVGTHPADILLKVLEQTPIAPSDRLGEPLPAMLDDLVRRCLAKNRDDRPADVEAILQTLDTLRFDQPWGEAEAQAWWQAHQPLPEAKPTA